MRSPDSPVIAELPMNVADTDSDNKNASETALTPPPNPKYARWDAEIVARCQQRYGIGMCCAIVFVFNERFFAYVCVCVCMCVRVCVYVITPHKHREIMRLLDAKIQRDINIEQTNIMFHTDY